VPIKVKHVLVCSALILSGCAATGPKMAQVADSFPGLASDHGRVFFYRTYASFGAAMRPEIIACGNKVGKSVPGGAFYEDIPAGRCDITVPTVIYGGERTLTLDVRAQETIYVRTWVGASGFGGRTNMEVVPEERAIAEIRTLALSRE